MNISLSVTEVCWPSAIYHAGALRVLSHRLPQSARVHQTSTESTVHQTPTESQNPSDAPTRSVRVSSVCQSPCLLEYFLPKTSTNSVRVPQNSMTVSRVHQTPARSGRVPQTLSQSVRVPALSAQSLGVSPQVL